MIDDRIFDLHEKALMRRLGSQKRDISAVFLIVGHERVCQTLFSCTHLFDLLVGKHALMLLALSSDLFPHAISS